MEKSWALRLQSELEKPYIQALADFLAEERSQYRIFPPAPDCFRAFQLTPFDAVKLVILGQDPYHQAGQANGLAFSVAKGVRIPPSLRNIYQELVQDCPEVNLPTHGDLSAWAKQGVLLLNTTLTVRESQAASHQKRGWETLTDVIIRTLSEQKQGLVFLLWGKFAQDKITLIDQEKHHILCASHPSPLSAYRGFLGAKPFSQANALLIQEGKTPIDWTLASESQGTLF